MSLTVEQAALSFVPAHPDLPHSAGVPAQAGSDDFIEALARVVFYWAYPGVDTYGRTNVWQIMEGERGTMLGILPGGPKNHTGGLGDYMSPAQRWVVTPNYDTIYGAGFFDLNADAVVVQTPVDVPTGHYWTIQIVDVMTNVVHQLGSASGTAHAHGDRRGSAAEFRDRECGRKEAGALRAQPAGHVPAGREP
jgi:hypothetical protein